MQGTLAFMAPEIIENDQCSYAQDVWSIGVILYALLSGSVPFGGSCRDEVQEAILEDELLG